MATETVGLVPCDLCGGNRWKQLLEKDGAAYCHCESCGFICTNPPVQGHRQVADAYYAKAIPMYAGKSYSPRKQAQYGRLLRRLAAYRHSGRFLEIGCNVGGMLYQARQQGWEATGIEPAAACGAYGREHYGLDIRTALIETVDLPAAAFDVVYSNAVFEHLPVPSRALAVTYQLLRPGGVTLINTVNYDSYTCEALGSAWHLLSPRGHVSLYTSVTLPAFCAKAGLEVIRVSSHGVRLCVHRSGGAPNLALALRKLRLSALSRFTKKGDRIVVLARKPGLP